MSPGSELHCVAKEPSKLEMAPPGPPGRSRTRACLLGAPKAGRGVQPARLSPRPPTRGQGLEGPHGELQLPAGSTLHTDLTLPRPGPLRRPVATISLTLSRQQTGRKRVTGQLPGGMSRMSTEVSESGSYPTTRGTHWEGSRSCGFPSGDCEVPPAVGACAARADSAAAPVAEDKRPPGCQAGLSRPRHTRALWKACAFTDNAKAPTAAALRPDEQAFAGLEGWLGLKNLVRALDWTLQQAPQPLSSKSCAGLGAVQGPKPSGSGGGRKSAPSSAHEQAGAQTAVLAEEQAREGPHPLATVQLHHSSAGHSVRTCASESLHWEVPFHAQGEAQVLTSTGSVLGRPQGPMWLSGPSSQLHCGAFLPTGPWAQKQQSGADDEVPRISVTEAPGRKLTAAHPAKPRAVLCPSRDGLIQFRAFSPGTLQLSYFALWLSHYILGASKDRQEVTESGPARASAGTVSAASSRLPLSQPDRQKWVGDSEGNCHAMAFMRALGRMSSMAATGVTDLTERGPNDASGVQRHGRGPPC
ncbi:hypothetical protein TREES_T100010378 [Tupaia chinensis]|uniref:Uncharacterized protein n=1 Tax=Tupaia chinensis TaxID=246437 RepID=L9LCP3_TUPCH|nr:hypothetical protein TREES_T100010378 [Tupaia chinensis]